MSDLYPLIAVGCMVAGLYGFVAVAVYWWRLPKRGQL